MGDFTIILIIVGIAFGVIYFLVPFFIWSLLYHINEKLDILVSRTNNNQYNQFNQNGQNQ